MKIFFLFFVADVDDDDAKSGKMFLCGRIIGSTTRIMNIERERERYRELGANCASSEKQKRKKNPKNL